MKTILKIMELALQINSEGAYYVFFEFSGRVNGLSIQVTHSKQAFKEDSNIWYLMKTDAYLSEEYKIRTMLEELRTYKKEVNNETD